MANIGFYQKKTNDKDIIQNNFVNKSRGIIMKTILMAAGIGSRLSRVITKPKCVLEVDNTPLIRHTVQMLLRQGIEIAVVVGYKREMIYEALQGLDVHFYFNPFYKVTNSMGSLWFAREFIDSEQDIILGNADVFCDDDILELLLSDQRDAVMLSDASRVDVGDYFFKTENERIVAYGKELIRENRDCEYVGLARLKANFLDGFKTRIDECIEDELYTMWWENILYNYSMMYPVYALDVNGRFWGEIDYIEDYERILNHLRAQKEKKRGHFE